MTDTERTDGMAKAYDPSQVEGPLYEAWLKGGYFRARIDPDKEPFCIIVHQHARLGASCDWDREVFTMDEGPKLAVRTKFVKLYNEGLIYRGERIINWCPRCQTALSDLEVEHEEVEGSLWYVRYPLLDDVGNMTDDYVAIATTRPETIVADVAIAVNPSVERWQKIVGRTALLPIIERQIPIIADEAVDPEFGTGALKITPGHDPVDFEIRQRHGLPP